MPNIPPLNIKNAWLSEGWFVVWVLRVVYKNKNEKTLDHNIICTVSDNKKKTYASNKFFFELNKTWFIQIKRGIVSKVSAKLKQYKWKKLYHFKL